MTMFIVYIRLRHGTFWLNVVPQHCILHHHYLVNKSALLFFLGQLNSVK